MSNTDFESKVTGKGLGNPNNPLKRKLSPSGDVGGDDQSKSPREMLEESNVSFTDYAIYVQNQVQIKNCWNVQYGFAGGKIETYAIVVQGKRNKIETFFAKKHLLRFIGGRAYERLPKNFTDADYYQGVAEKSERLRKKRANITSNPDSEAAIDRINTYGTIHGPANGFILVDECDLEVDFSSQIMDAVAEAELNSGSIDVDITFSDPVVGQASKSWCKFGKRCTVGINYDRSAKFVIVKHWRHDSKHVKSEKINNNYTIVLGGTPSAKKKQKT